MSALDDEDILPWARAWQSIALPIHLRRPWCRRSADGTIERWLRRNVIHGFP